MKISQHKILLQELFPITFVVLLWLIHLTQVYLETSFAPYTLFPRTAVGLLGIVTSPLVHGDFEHLISNSIPMLVCGMLLYGFYDKLAHRIFFLIYFMTGISTWLGARPAWHLGASGVLYGLMAFLFLSGVLRRHRPLMVVSLLVVFLYGSAIWGILPMQPEISWEGHLCGALSGFAFAIYFRKEGPQRQVYSWENESDEEPAPLILPEESSALQPNDAASVHPEPPAAAQDFFHPHAGIRYIYIEGKKEKDKE